MSSSTLRRTAALCVGIASLPVLAAAQTSIAPAVDRAARGLAHVSVLFDTGGDAVRVERSSSGFVVDPSGLLVTNEHLVDEIPVGGGAEGEEYWLVVLLGGGRPCNAKLVARDERLDLALLQLELEEDEKIPAIELASGPAPAPGSDVFVLGRPRGGSYFALAGTVSHPNGPVALRDGTLARDEVLISDAAVLEDVNGGPFLDRRGRALGIVNTFQRLPYDSKTENLSVRNPIDYSLVVRADAIRGAFPAQLAARAEGAAPKAGEPDVAARIVQQVAPAVVSVWAGPDDTRPAESAPNDPYGKKLPKGLGSGVVVDPAGLVLTSYDFVGEATDVGVATLDGKRFRGKVVRVEREKRVALIQLELPEGVRLSALALGSSDAALHGETVAVIGNPYGHTPTVSVGVLSALEVDERVRIGAWVHDGHKGGALVDSTCRLIGLPAADIFEGKEESSRGESYLGVAIPIDRVRGWFGEELERLAPALRTVPVATDEELAQRRDTVTAIVAATRDSLLNVEIKAEAPRAASFDPFATPGELKLLGQGSGVVIDEKGLAITNWHVVDATLADDDSQRSDRALEVTLPSGRRYSARVLATSRDDDLGLIQLQLPEGERVEPVPLGASKPLRRGDVLVAIGNPYGKANTVTVGIVAAKDQDALIQGRLHVYPDMLQTDAAINPGNSGGALLDLEGKLVGINSAGRSGAGLAIPVERVREVFGQKLLATMGPFLGISVEDAPGGGVRITAVDEHGPAQAAGIAKDDVLRSIDGRSVATTVEYGNVLLAKRIGAELQLELDRAGESRKALIRPISHAAWRVFRQTGIEVEEVDYATESEAVRQASIALHRAYTGLADGVPTRLMAGALRVVQATPRGDSELAVQKGDLLLGASAVVRTIDAEHAKLVRFESLAALRDFFEPLSSREGGAADCWILRDGKAQTARVVVFKAR